MLIEVTQDHILRGEPDCRGACPVALALADAGYAEADVDAFEIHYVNDEGVDVKLRTPRVASQFIFDFDDETVREFVLPFKFELQGPAA